MALGRVHRLVRLLTLLQGGGTQSAQDLMHELSVSRRTLFRDLSMLKEAGVPVYHDAISGYRIHRSFYLPPINLTVTEVVGLLVLAKLASAERHRPMAAAALSAVRKLVGSVPEPLREACVDLTRGLSASANRPPAEADAETRFYGVLQRCVDEGRACRVEYRAPLEAEPLVCELEPYALHFENQAWYVFGWTDVHDEVRVLKVLRLVSVETTDRRFDKRDAEKVVRDKLGSAWRLIPEGKVSKVELLFEPKVAQNVAEVRWHASQQTRLRDDGRLEMRLRVDGLSELAWWVCGYADQVRIIEPAALRERVKLMHRRAVEMMNVG